MPDPITPVTGTEHAGATPGAAATTPPAQPTGETLEQLRESLAKTQAALKDANKEAASRRTRLAELEAKEAAATEAGKTEAQKLQDQIAKLQAERDGAVTLAQERLIRSSAVSEAARLQFRDPADALSFIDKAKLKVADDGSVEGLAEQLAALAKAKPYLLATTLLGAQSPSNPGAGAQTGETAAQKRARMYGGSSGASLGGGYVPIKE